jgi:hypothetical protein
LHVYYSFATTKKPAPTAFSGRNIGSEGRLLTAIKLWDNLLSASSRKKRMAASRGTFEMKLMIKPKRWIGRGWPGENHAAAKINSWSTFCSNVFGERNADILFA